MAATPPKRLRELVAPGRADPLRRRGGRERLAAAAVHAADRALHPRPAPGAERARLLRRRAAPRSSPPDLAGPYLEELGIAVPAEAPQARGARRRRLPLPAVGRLDRLLARRGSPDARDRRARGRRRGRRGRDRGGRPASRAADAGHAARAGDRDDRPRRHRRGARRGAGLGGRRRRRLGAHLPRRDPRQRRRAGRGRRRARAGRRRARGRGLPPADHHASPVQGRRRRPRARTPGPARAPTAGAGSPPGAGRPRPGGYRLAEDGARRPRGVLADPRLPLDAVRRPAKSERTARRAGAGDLPVRGRARARVVLEALNDYLLALRFLLEGGGPADLGLAMRVAALCAEPEQRGRDQGDRSTGPLALERELWSGEPAPAAMAPPTPAETAAAVEELRRAILEGRRLRPPRGRTCARPRTRSCSPTGSPSARARAEQRGGAEEWDAPAERDRDRRRGRLRIDDPRDVGRRARRRAPGPTRPNRSTTLRTGARRGAPAEDPRARALEPARSRSGSSVPARVARGRSAGPKSREPVQVPEPEGESGSSHAPVRGGDTCSTNAQPRATSRPTATSRGPVAQSRRRGAALLDELPAEDAPERPPDDRRPRRLPLPAPGDHRVGRARAELRPPPPRRRFTAPDRGGC